LFGGSDFEDLSAEFSRCTILFSVWPRILAMVSGIECDCPSHYCNFLMLDLDFYFIDVDYSYHGIFSIAI